MSTTFKEFLQRKAEKLQAEIQAGEATVDEWRSAIEKLFARIRGWLRESDPDGLIQIEEGQEEVSEPGLGRYRVPRLDLRAFGKWIGIIPKARKTVGKAIPPQKSAPERAEGRVDITDELRRYVLYRFRENAEDQWLIDGLDQGGGFLAELPAEPGPMRPIQAKPLDREVFETALMSYLR